MNIKQLKEKLSTVLSPEEIAGVEKSFNEAIALRVKEETDKIEKLAEEYCVKKIEEGRLEIMAEAKDVLEEEIDKLEESIVDKLDRYLDTTLEKTINESKVLSIAINETYSPIIQGIVSLFEDKFVALDTEGAKKVAELESQNKQLEESLSKSIEENMELSELAESAAKKMLINSKTKELSESQKIRVSKLISESSFDDLHSKIDDVISLVTETRELTADDMREENEDDGEGEEGSGPVVEDENNEDDGEGEKGEEGEEDESENIEDGLQKILSIASKLVSK